MKETSIPAPRTLAVEALVAFSGLIAAAVAFSTGFHL